MSKSATPSGEDVFEAYDLYLTSELEGAKPNPAYVAQLQALEAAPIQLLNHWEDFLESHLASRFNDPALEIIREQAQAAYNFEAVVDIHVKA